MATSSVSSDKKVPTKKIVAAIITKEDKFLIAKRASKDCNFGKWEFPGGKMELGESEVETLRRELKEELGIEAHIGDFFCSSFFEHKNSIYEMRTYFVPNFTGTIILNDHSEIKWISCAELTNYEMPDPDKPVVEKLQKVRTYDTAQNPT